MHKIFRSICLDTKDFFPPFAENFMSVNNTSKFHYFVIIRYLCVTSPPNFYSFDAIYRKFIKFSGTAFTAFFFDVWTSMSERFVHLQFTHVFFFFLIMSLKPCEIFFEFKSIFNESGT